MLNKKGFDLWANGYDKSVNISEENNEYPFAGYKDVLNFIYNEVREHNCASILDIGFGTAILTTQLYKAGCSITGIDFSSNMIDIAKQKMPGATLLNWDFSKGLPDEVMNSRFDCIISTYALHHLTAKEKIPFIEALTHLLSKRGMMLIGDISFETRYELEKIKEEFRDLWDYDEVYFTVDELQKSLNNICHCKYFKISHCAGVLAITE